MTKIVEIRKRKVTDFVAIDSGTDAVTLSLFHGGDSMTLEVSPKQAKDISKELKERAEEIERTKGGG